MLIEIFRTITTPEGWPALARAIEAVCPNSRVDGMTCRLSGADLNYEEGTEVVIRADVYSNSVLILVEDGIRGRIVSNNVLIAALIDSCQKQEIETTKETLEPQKEEVEK